MPSLESRRTPADFVRTPASPTANAPAPTIDPGQLAPRGNPAPFRGLLPLGLMNDVDVVVQNPTAPIFTRGLVPENQTTLAIALQALAAAGVIV